MTASPAGSPATPVGVAACESSDPASVIRAHEASSPSRTASASRVSSSSRVDRLLEADAEFAEHRQLALAVAEDGAVDPPLEPSAHRQQADGEQSWSAALRRRA